MADTCSTTVYANGTTMKVYENRLNDTIKTNFPAIVYSADNKFVNKYFSNSSNVEINIVSDSPMDEFPLCVDEWTHNKKDEIKQFKNPDEWKRDVYFIPVEFIQSN